MWLRSYFIIICWIKGIYWTYLYSSFNSLSLGFISGHDFVEQDDNTLKCKICNKISK
jgi:hypothetical protein